MPPPTLIYVTVAILAFLTVFVVPSVADERADSTDELAKQLTNPVADLISLPFQFNYTRTSARMTTANASPSTFSR